MIFGVSGWLGQKFNMKEGTVRILFVISFLLFGAGLGLYLIFWIVKILSK
ncbi:MAG: PspC domain-containing protein [Cyclobacteriaceae bacterium]|jgi:phage shock protein PspC (stress-responsive transcriptional regulator)